MDSGRLIFDSSLGRVGGSQMIKLGGRNATYGGTVSLLAMAEGGEKRRPFFTGPDEYFEEYYDEQAPEKKRRMTPEQVHLLEKSFEADNKLEPEKKSELARKLGLQPRQIAVWFQNRKARSKNKQLETDYDRLKASYDSLLSDHGSLLKTNDELRSQVRLLTEKLQEKEKPEVKAKDQVSSTADAGLTTLNVQQKSEDRLSSGSAVFDGERAQQLVNGCAESYFPSGYNDVKVLNNGGVQSEEDDVSDEGCSYYPEQIFTDYHQSEVDAQLWFDWS